MVTSYDHTFAELSAACRRYIRAGQIDSYSATLKEMAKLLESDGRFTDELKLLIPAFYIDLSGFARAPYIDSGLSAMLQTAVSGAGIDVEKLRELYFELIQPDVVSRHTMSINESWYLFQLYIENKAEQAEYILSRI